MKIITLFFFSTIMIFFVPASDAQTITGAWKGKINNTKVELKLIKSGDSLSGTVYYYTSKTNYRRYSVKGYFDGKTNDVIWWDDWLIEDHAQKSLVNGNPAQEARLNVADFNCPGEDEMLLDGTSNLKDDIESPKKEIHLQKSDEHIFNDDWDWVIENYLVGGNNPDLITKISVEQGTMPFPEETAIAPVILKTKIEPPIVVAAPPIVKVPSGSNEQKFSSRKKVVQTVIPVTAETIELRFYDNAQVDGDSIALFLNNKMIFEQIRLTDKAYTIKINASDLNEDNELVMVAENLGSIPPNTSFMVAIVGDKRYEARLFANENSSAVIRLVKHE
ncbi:MAG: hypothetical protein H7Y31_10725 [Chitinophagaceae bacterium]|nr:hypothetical protein [Chitinophagaceae bacterium]